VLGSKNLEIDSLQGATYDKLCSVVYCALNCFHSPNELRKKWRKLGAYGLSQMLVLSASRGSGWSPDAIELHPWIAHCLRPYDENGLLPIVEQWLAGEPLAAHISERPEDEDLKIRRIKKLLFAINDT
jgi:hypothetical protein